MPPHQEISAINEVIDEITSRFQSIIASGQQLPPELIRQVTDALNYASNRIVELRSIESPIPQGTDLLWILAGGNPQAFIEYLRTFPDPAYSGLLANREQLFQIIRQLSERIPEGIHLEADGIEHAPLLSSNIYGFKYDPNQGQLLVRFNNGGIYSYGGVPQSVFNIFRSGAVPAKTNGRNQYGEWWKGKIPSLGAAFYELIRNGGYPYQKLS